MSRILLAWELGSGYGHVAIMRGVARALQALGHECLFAVKDLRAAEEFFSADLGPVFQAPRGPATARRPVKLQLSFASLLHNTGFDDPVGLAALLRAWRQLLQSQHIDAVLANHAPMALLAARTLGLPRGIYGASFTVPPLLAPFPSFQPQIKVEDEVLLRNEAQVLLQTNTALERLGLAPLQRLQQVFEDCHTRIFGYAELDAYGRARPPASHAGIPDQSHGDAPPWPDLPGPRVFAYLRPFPHLEPVLRALQASRINAIVRVADFALEKLQPFTRPGLVFTARSIHLRQAAEQCDAMIHYGPDGSTAEMLLAGKPGLLLPVDVEKMLLSWRAQQLGAALVSEGLDQQRIGALLERLLEDPELKRNAQAFADRYRKQDRDAILPDYAADFARSL